jgi:hypothetical protein
MAMTVWLMAWVGLAAPGEFGSALSLPDEYQVDLTTGTVIRQKTLAVVTDHGLYFAAVLGIGHLARRAVTTNAPKCVGILRRRSTIPGYARGD